MPRLELSFLGPPHLARGGDPVTVDTRKAVALLALLALSEAPRTREQLTILLWPEHDRAHARAALRRTLSTLKKAVGDGVLSIDREVLAIDEQADLWLDTAAFQAAWHACGEHQPDGSSCLEALEAAVALYRGDFLAGFTLRDSAAFDDWQWEQADVLRRELARYLERLVEGHQHRGNLTGAIEHARRWLELDPLHEAAQRTLMRLLAWAGQRSEALRHYRTCVRILELELGVPPLEETTELYRAIKENRLPAPPLAPASVQAPLRGERTVSTALPHKEAQPSPGPPLIAREQEWGALEQARRQATEERYLLAIEGEAGIGKTYLTEAFLTSIGSDAVTLSARCYQGENHLAYGPFIELLKGALGLPGAAGRLAGIEPRWLAEASRLAPDLGSLVPELPPPAPLDGPAGRSHFFEGIDRVLTELVAQRPGTVLLLDDLHWAHSATLELLAYLSRPEREHGLLLLVTLRPDRNEAHERVLQLVAEGEREGRSRLLELDRWGLEDVEELLEETGSQLAPEVIGRLFEESEGLPFFVTEYLSALSQQEVWELPRGARELLRSRFEAVPDMERQLLQTAAAIGRSFEFDLLRHASGRSDDEVVAGLELLVGRDIVREVSGGPVGSIRFDFTHEKMRTLVYEETSLVRRRLLHGRIAQTLVGDGHLAPERAAVASLVGFHLRLAGREREAALHFGRAGDHARSLFANREALHHYETALALGHPEPATLHEALGDLRTLTGEYETAIAQFETAAARGDGARLAHLEHKLGNVHQRRGAWETAESHYRAAEELLDGVATQRDLARLLADRSLNAHRRGRADEALALAGEALSLGERDEDIHTLAQVHNMLGMLAHRRGDLVTSTRSLEFSLSLTEEHPDPSARIAALNNLALVRAAAGDPDAGLELLATALELCRRQGDRHREAALLNNSADLLHAAGRREEAMDRLKQAAAIYAAIGKEQGDWQPEIWKLVEW